ncbi:unnamed protein product [Rotaria magnacalcarata]|uniref:Ceramide phosphoethanolamine synthase n=2 Tax=Rotaria magnacalcarata TaxID=392030 RepID=A0A815TVZ2_9BILA|nr:unnamed protein product [Rotaria magnacalcarata]CAF1558638.1 unnamed protein product [Rotaria magnacalcarata]CAF1923306.1 unnamed protein product [Rotaria magnacalcarata]CAF2075015.1 unnamed protein product [Rotaria magnacalcarata]CAF2134133.1 unnamed protein product [Rotaria magnacalcarata]
MVVDVRKLSIGPGPARPVHQHGHFCVRAFHCLVSYPGYSLFILFLLYLQIMDIILYFKIRTRDSLDFSSSNQTNTQSVIHSVCIFNPLPIKKIMVEPIVHYVRSPLAESVETKLHFTYYFPFISANAISYFHCFLSLVSMKFVASESFSRRQLGVVIFQFRTFLDCLDGVVFRAHSNNKRYKSYYGDFGYYVDALSDILGGTCLIIGCLLYFYKERPFRSKSTATATINSSVLPSSSASDGGGEDSDLMILNLEDDQSCSHVSSSPRKNDLSSNLLETKRTIFITLLVFSLRYAISAFFWDRYVRLYEELLDSQTNTLQQKALQLSILHSPLTIVIFYLWRYLCALSLQDYLLFAIFIDRTWEFILKTSTIGWFALMLTAFLTELHVNQVQSVFAALTTS